MSGWVGFVAPWWLLALLVVPYAAWAWRRYTALPGTAPRQRWVPWVRALTLTALVLALAGASIWAPRPGVDLHVLLDLSASVPADQRTRARRAVETLAGLLGPEDRMRVYGFGRDLVFFGAVDRDSPVLDLSGSVDPTATDIARALRAVLDRAPADANARVVLLSDGVETLGDAGAMIHEARSRGIPVDALYLGHDRQAEVMVEDLLVPGVVTPGEAYSVRAVVVSGADTRATLRLYRDGTLVARREVEIVAGRNLVAFEGFKEVEGGDELITYELWLDPVDDGYTENNVGYALVRVQDDARVLVVARELEAGERLRAVLEEAGIAAEVRSSSSLPQTAALGGYRAVVLIDVPAVQLSQAHMAALSHYVEELGGGILAIGGPYSFGLGGYARTPLEEILPVSMDAPQSVIMPSLAMVLALDRSGSMAETQGAFSKLDLAKEAALGVLDLLSERDLIGVLAFDSYPYWVVPVQPVENRISIASSIASLSAEGGTNLGPALDAVHRSLAGVEAALKHVVVLTDGRSTPADFESLSQALRASGVTVSTVGIGRDADRELLANIARWGDGRYYYTEDIRAIPQIFATETTVIARPMRVDEPFVPEWHQQADFWQDRTSLPPLGGHVITSPKASAAVHLKAPDDSPILATWRRGLGRAAAFTASIEEPWVGGWRQWEGYGAFMGQLVRWLMRSDPAEGLIPQMTISGGRLRLMVDALDAQGGFENFLELTAEVLAPGGDRYELEMRQVGPGRYEVDAPVGAQGVYTAYVRSRDGESTMMAVAGAVLAYPDEYRVLRPDSGLLARLAQETSGSELDDLSPESLARLLTHPAPARRPYSLVPHLLALALALAFFDIALRYFPWSTVAELFARTRRGDSEDPEPVRLEDALRQQMAEDLMAWEKASAAGRPGTPAASHDAHQAGRYLASRKKRERDDRSDPAGRDN